MKLPIHKHEDSRRLLVEYISDLSMRMSKVIYIKEDSILGNHYHKLKDDIFFLVKGSGTYMLNGKLSEIKEGDCIFVKSGLPHSFYLKRDSILIESSTLPYDKGDEYEISQTDEV